MVKYHSDKLSEVFQALADPTRRKILKRISKGRPTVQQIAQPFKMSLPAVSKHLKVLEKAELIERIKVGRTYHFELVDRPINDAKKWIESYTVFWNKQLDQLGNYLKKKRSKN
ncbi:MAG TPA: metalloregulator ArsR/SmtB family transcription factor [Verrucomicrobiae bacterium]|nr:metalloregulator ArsR/SmtB family transcription factor [Verrucomicrobiae bacterium]